MKSKNPSNSQKNKKKENPYCEDHNHNQKNLKIVFNSSLKSGTLLSNGSCYLLQKNGLILNYYLNSYNSHYLISPPPSHGLNKKNAIIPSFTLYNSIEQELKKINCQNILRSKQSSMFGGMKTVHSGPADLVKLFTKTRDINYKKENDKFEKFALHVTTSLSMQSSASNSRDENDKIDKNDLYVDGGSSDRSPKSNKMNLFFSNKDKDKDKDKEKKEDKVSIGRTDEVSNLMSENMKNLEERGEKLNRLNNLAEDLNNGAETFRDLVKQHKSELKKKATRWGGIL